MFPPSYKDINRIVTEKYLNYNSGFFIEVGGADGYTQSNTWYLEKYKNWTGILVEPNQEAFEVCVGNRPKSKVFNNALVNQSNPNTEITMVHRRVFSDDPGLMSATKDSSIWKSDKWVAKACALDEEEIKYEFTVNCRTLDSILEECNVDTVDFFSLDVEGYELEVLDGFSIDKYLPKILLIEWHEDIKDIIARVGNTHTLAEQLSEHDFLFTLR
jgi:FkbM family methyltransferase